MNRVLRCLFCTFTFAALAAAQTRTHPKASSTSANSSAQQTPAKTAPKNANEPFVIERYATTVRFENDGTGERDLFARVRVQNDAGAQSLQELIFGYRAPNEQVDVHYARVRHPDGTIANAEPGAIKEIPIALASDAPAYAAAMEKHIPVPTLHPGDILEYEIATRLTVPFAPREFWFQQDFLDNEVVLDEELNIDVPQSRAVIVQSPNFPRETTQSNGRAIYSWKRTNTIVHSNNDATSPEALARAAKIPDVQLTSFATWQAVAKWYANLERGRSEPTPEIAAKAQQLVAGHAAETGKSSSPLQLHREKYPLRGHPTRPRRISAPFRCRSLRQSIRRRERRTHSPRLDASRRGH